MNTSERHDWRTRTRILSGILIVSLGIFAVGCSETPLAPTDAGRPTQTTAPKAAGALGNGLIVYESVRTGNLDVFLVRDDGTGEVNLTNHPADDRAASISPDGTRIAFASDRDGHHGVYVMVVDPATLAVTGLEEVLSGTTDWSGYHATDWAADGSHLLVEARRDNKHIVDRLDLDTGTTEQLIPRLGEENQLDARCPQYNGDGTRIHAYRLPPYQGYAGDVYVHDADGSNAQRLTDLPGVQTWWPTEVIVGGAACFLFTHINTSNQAQIYMGYPDGQLVNLSDSVAREAAPRVPGGPGRELFPEWFVMHSDRNGSNDIYLRTVADEQTVRITTAGGARPDWWAGLPAELPASMEFHPETLNLQSNGQYVTVHLEGSGWDAGEVDPASVLLCGAVGLAREAVLGDEDGDGIADLTLKFDRLDLRGLLEFGDEIPVWITGALTNGTPFRADDLIRVIGRGRGGTAGAK